jgi:hypothetical protein
MPALIVLSFLACETYFVPPVGTAPARPLLDAVRRLEPYAGRISAPAAVFLAGEHSFSLGGYLVRPRVTPEPRVLGTETFARLGAGEPVEVFLERSGVALVYFDEGVVSKLLSNPLHRAFLEAPGPSGWRTLASGQAAESRWLLLARTPL